MTAQVLVAYATKYGSTRGVAEAIASRLAEQGMDVDLQPVGEVRSLDRYDAVVLGAPIYIGRFIGDAQQFLSRYQTALAERRVAVFALGPLNATDDEFTGARSSLDEELARYPSIVPFATAVFGGVYDPSKPSFAHKMLAMFPASPLHGRIASDIRDWVEIRTWAGEVAGQLQPAAVG